METLLEVITSDGRRVGHVAASTMSTIWKLQKSGNAIPQFWIARVEQEVILKKPYKDVINYWEEKASELANVQRESR